MRNLTESQSATIASIRAEFDAMPEPQRSGAYTALAAIAVVKWPELAEHLRQHPLGKAAIAAGLAITLAGCPQADILAGNPSPAQVEAERRVEAGLAPVFNPWVETVEQVAEPETVEPETVEPEPPPCVEVFRVTRCIDGQAVDWSM